MRTRKPRLTGVLLWTASVVATTACFAYQDKTGPTYPLEGDFGTVHGTAHFKILRSEIIGSDLAVMLLDPVPSGVTGFVQYRRFTSDDE